MSRSTDLSAALLTHVAAYSELAKVAADEWLKALLRRLVLVVAGVICAGTALATVCCWLILSSWGTASQNSVALLVIGVLTGGAALLLVLACRSTAASPGAVRLKSEFQKDRQLLEQMRLFEG